MLPATLIPWLNTLSTAARVQRVQRSYRRPYGDTTQQERHSENNNLVSNALKQCSPDIKNTYKKRIPGELRSVRLDVGHTVVLRHVNSQRDAGAKRQRVPKHRASNSTIYLSMRKQRSFDSLHRALLVGSTYRAAGWGKSSPTANGYLGALEGPTKLATVPSPGVATVAS